MPANAFFPGYPAPDQVPGIAMILTENDGRNDIPSFPLTTRENSWGGIRGPPGDLPYPSNILLINNGFSLFGK
jgi:hypothetical protein